MRRLLALILLALVLPSTSHATSSISVTITPDPTAGSAATVTASGVSDAPATLFVFARAATSACPTSAYSAAGDSWISPSTGVAIAAGSFNQSMVWNPANGGATRICALLATSQWGSALTAAFVDTSVQPPAADLNIQLSPSPFVPGDTVSATISASTAASGRELRWTFTSSGSACPGSPPPSGALPLTSGTRATKTTGQPTSSSDSVVRMCAWVVRASDGAVDKSVEATATRMSPAELDALFVAKPVTADGEEQFDRLDLVWITRSDPADERVYIWDEDPADGADPKVIHDADDEHFELMDSPSDERDLRVRHFLGFRQFWWQVKTSTPYGTTVLSPIQTVVVSPSPLDPELADVSPKLQLKHSSQRPGIVRLRIASSPRARVRLTVRYRGRVFARRHYTEGVGALRGIEFQLSCARTGIFSYEVRIRDPYGAKAVRRGHWTSSASRCASLRAEERRKAAAEQRKKQKAANPGSSGDSGGSGSNCVAGYSRCLKPGIGDYDCAGGSGDGPNYVNGPIGVSGDDPFGLDSDNDGVGCES